jgi:uncharacterized membrane protein
MDATMTSSTENNQSSLAAAEAKPVARAKSARLWEIDTLRGVAVVTMIWYHLAWDLWYFGAVPTLDPFHGWLRLLQRYTCISFIMLAGLSLTLVNQQLLRRGLGNGDRFRHFLRRGLIVFGWGMVLTVVMRVSGVGRIDFGVLHLIGFSIVAAFPFLPYKWLNLALWAILLVLGGWILTVTVQTYWLVWLGFMPAGYDAVDYFPIIPWFGVALLGVFFGNLLYPQGRRGFPLPDWSDWFAVRGLRWLGSHSLPIYLLHQPILFAILFALGIAHL